MVLYLVLLLGTLALIPRGQEPLLTLGCMMISRSLILKESQLLYLVLVMLQVTQQIFVMQWVSYMIASRMLVQNFMVLQQRQKSNSMNPRLLWMVNLLAWFSIKTTNLTRVMKELKDGSKLSHLKDFLCKIV